MQRTACIAGASGLVGSELLRMLLEDGHYSKVISLGRRELTITHGRLRQVITDFEQIERQTETVDDVFCCLGTTIKKARSKQQMTKVDVTFPMQVARWGLEHGAKQFILISAMNANAKSPFFYPRIKGQLEEKIQELSYESVAILRPSLLLGERQEFRFAEHSAATLIRAYSKLTGKKPSSRMAIEAKTVAEGMISIAKQRHPGVNIYTSENISLAAGAEL